MVPLASTAIKFFGPPKCLLSSDHGHRGPRFLGLGPRVHVERICDFGFFSDERELSTPFLKLGTWILEEYQVLNTPLMIFFAGK